MSLSILRGVALLGLLLAPLAAAVPSSPDAAHRSSNPPLNTEEPVGHTCMPEGIWNCYNNGKTYQRCASTQWSVPQSMAAGTVCGPLSGQPSAEKGITISFAPT